MSRNTSMDPPVFQFKAAAGEIRTYRFLTYVFGGGVKVNKHERFFDERTPVRTASIRGQLRFWWRACNPSGCTTLQELRQREGEIWGTTSRPSQVVVEVVSNLRDLERKRIFGDNQRPLPGMEKIAYAAFPLQVAKEDRKSGATPGVLFNYGDSRFQLRLIYPDSVKDDVAAALWAWETFGGLGARTRRGFGAVQRISPAQKTDQETNLEAELKKLSALPRIDGVPSLSGARFARSPESYGSAQKAWEEGLGCLQKLRQGPGVGRNPPGKAPSPPPPGWRPKPAGRSRWPEPDAIRRLTGKSAPLHSTPLTHVDVFPRAAFGMPIIFHFHPGQDNHPPSQGDPKMKLELRPVEADRFASPVILRPMILNKEWFFVALVLTSPTPDAVLAIAEKPQAVAHVVSPADAPGIPALKDSKGVVHTDPIERFLAEIKK